MIRKPGIEGHAVLLRRPWETCCVIQFPDQWNAALSNRILGEIDLPMERLRERLADL